MRIFRRAIILILILCLFSVVFGVADIIAPAKDPGVYAQYSKVKKILELPLEYQNIYNGYGQWKDRAGQPRSGQFD